MHVCMHIDPLMFFLRQTAFGRPKLLMLSAGKGYGRRLKTYIVSTIHFNDFLYGKC